ncbi:helix-turn-helix domain-containing protein [Streptomyces sp. NPDC086835]|uniref:helix-turn-helix domain-containing protein n=1 Tax=Streptomyces sp. NPDC086835 TaxID=3365761 RepID=UPI0037F71425
MAVPQLNAPLCASPPVPTVGIRHVDLPHNERFVVVGNHLAQHDRLSLTAIGLAVHIQSLRTGTRISVKKLAERFPEGEDRIADALNELERYGYLRRTRVRLPSGQLITTTESFNNPPAMRVRAPGQPVPVPRREAPPPSVEPPVPDPVAGPEAVSCGSRTVHGTGRRPSTRGRRPRVPSPPRSSRTCGGTIPGCCSRSGTSAAWPRPWTPGSSAASRPTRYGGRRRPRCPPGSCTALRVCSGTG